MRRDVLLPQVELTMESALIAKWLVRAGDYVKADQPLVEVETQKAVSEVPSPVAGFVRKLCVKEGETVNEKALLCILTDSAHESLDSAEKPPALPGETERGPLKATPAARRIAKERGVDLASAKGTGPGGRISEEDVRAAAGGEKTSYVPFSSGDWTTLPATRLALIAQMQKSLAEIPQIQIKRRGRCDAALSVKTSGITFTHRLVLALAAALRQHPVLRTIIDGSRVKVEPVSVAIAMDTPSGLIAPAVRNADKLSLQEISAAVSESRAKATANSLHRADLTGAPFALTNLGMLGVDQFDAFVFHGQTAVLSVGRSTDDGDRKFAWFGLAADHRVVDGAEAARFLQTLQTEISKT